MSILPFVVTLALYLMNPNYLNKFFSDPTGQKIIAFAFLMLVAGIFIIQKMARIKV
jgi:Flp pilus assembly protein TadB